MRKTKKEILSETMVGQLEILIGKAKFAKVSAAFGGVGIFKEDLIKDIGDAKMGRKITKTGLEFREKFGYTGKLTKECMGKELWNEYFKMKSKERNASLEHKELIAERKEIRRVRQTLTLKQKKETGAYLEAYCKDYTNIENYEKALKDKFVGWQCHHRLETHTSDGERRFVDITAKELIALKMYYNRPAEELILMKTIEHRRLHLRGKPNARRKKCI